MTFCAEKINLSGISPAKHSRSGPNSYTWTCQGVTTFREFWARSAHFGQNGSGTSPAEPEFFFSVVIETTFRQLRIFAKFGHETYFGVPSMNPERQFLNFHFRGHLPPKSEIENRSNRHLTQSRLQVTCCTAEILYCLLHSPGSTSLKAQ